MFSVTFKFQLTWAHEQIWLKLPFQTSLLIPSRKLCVILITDTNYIISSSLAIEASIKIHQVKDMIIIIILNSFATCTWKCHYHWNPACEHVLFKDLHKMHSEIKRREHFLHCIDILLPRMLSFDKVIQQPDSSRNHCNGAFAIFFFLSNDITTGDKQLWS